MIQFNLLPDIKIEYLKARRQKRLVMLGSTVATVACVALLAVLISIVFGLQKKNISDLNRDIQNHTQQLQKTPNLSRMLTVQNQLTSLTALHDGKPSVNRLYTYITQVTPTAASISKLSINFVQNTVSVSGAADTLETINSFADALKFATYHTADAPNTELPAFSSVVLSSFGRDNKGATYTLTFSINPALFSGKFDVVLTVPNLVTRSTATQPSDLFKKAGQ